MVTGTICRNCGRSGGGGNIVTTLDKMTQDYFFTEIGYVFINPYWHEGFIPDPEGYELARGLLHEEGQVGDSGRLELTKKVGEKCLISFYLSKFRFSWVYTNEIICSISYKYRHFFDKATFFMRTHNERQVTFYWLKDAIKSCYELAGYEADEKDDYKWKKRKAIEEGTEKPRESPPKQGLDLLKEVESLIIKYTQECFGQYDELRKCYTQEYLDEVTEKYNDFAPKKESKWFKYEEEGVTILPRYKDIRAYFYYQLESFVEHLKHRLNDNRDDYLLYLPVDFSRVNEYNTKITLKRDPVDEWWKRTYSLDGLWQFSQRPFTKKMIEEFDSELWKNAKTGAVEPRVTPLKTCIFCPTDAGMSPSRSDDFVIDRRSLMRAGSGWSDMFESVREGSNKELNETFIVNHLAALASKLVNVTNEDLKNFTDEDLSEILNGINNSVSGINLIGDVKKNFETITKFLTRELRRRNKEDQYVREVRKEFEEATTNLRSVELLMAELAVKIRRAKDDDNFSAGEVRKLQDAAEDLDRIGRYAKSRIENSKRQLKIWDKTMSAHERDRELDVSGALRFLGKNESTHRINKAFPEISGL